MNPWSLVALGFIIAAVGLAWGLIMLIAPRKFAELSRVDWMPDVFDIRRKGVRLELRIIGIVTTAVALYFLYLLVQSAHHLIETT
jgi:Ca2+/Na+ antiporter